MTLSSGGATDDATDRRIHIDKLFTAAIRFIPCIAAVDTQLVAMRYPASRLATRQEL